MSPTSPKITSSPGKESKLKNANLIFKAVWQELEDEHGAENLRFPKEIIWLCGAPGAGKGTNTPFITRERGMTANPIIMSDLLNSPEMQRLKDNGQLVGDRECVDILLRELLLEKYVAGVVVDGFPRTSVQAEVVKLLFHKMLDLRKTFFNKPFGPSFRRPIFRITVLYVDEKTSIERQLARGLKIKAHNEQVERNGEGHKQELRSTDLDEAAARSRYRTFQNQTFQALQELRKYFYYHLVNAQAPLDEVEKHIIQEMTYQSTLELGHDTHDAINDIPLASEIILHARQELVKSLDNYQSRYTELFSKVLSLLESEFVPVIRRHAIAGRARIKSQNPVFDEAMPVDMVIDVLSERGYHVTYDSQRIPIPESFETNTGRINLLERRVHTYDVRFSAPRNPSR